MNLWNRDARNELLESALPLRTPHRPASAPSSIPPFQEEVDAANTMARMAQLANQNAEYNPNLSVAMGVDQPTIVDSGSEGDWSD